MKKGILIAPSDTVRSFLPLDQYGIDIVFPNKAELFNRIGESDTVMFSLLSYGDYRGFYGIYKSGMLNGKKIVVGGALLNILKHPEQLLDYFDIEHLCIGKGERFIKSFCEGRPMDRVYREDKPVSQLDMLLADHSPLDKIKDLNLVFNSRCRWNKCLFCHHTHDDLRQCIDHSQLGEVIKLVHNRPHINRLHILDNDVDIGFIAENILDNEQLMSRLELIDIFGIRCSGWVAKLEEYVRRYSDTLFTMGFGLEFVTQFFLDLYHKGYNIEHFRDKNSYLFTDKYKNLKISMYCLIGMPFMDSNYYRELSDFIEEHKHIEFKLSYFLMDDAIMANFNNFENLEVLENISTSDFGGMESVPSLETIHRRFRHLGTSQYDHFKQVLEPSGLLRHRNTLIDGSLYPFVFPGRKEFNMAVTLYRQQEYKAAIREVTKAIEAGYDYSKDNVHWVTGSCYERVNQFDKARAQFEKAKEANPTDCKVYFALSHCYRKLGQMDKADSNMRRGLLLHKANLIESEEPAEPKGFIKAHILHE